MSMLDYFDASDSMIWDSISNDWRMADDASEFVVSPLEYEDDDEEDDDEGPLYDDEY